jgi:hypothetical protein
MRRLCLAGALTLAIIGGTATTVLTQESDGAPQPPEEVTGTFGAISYISNGATEDVALGPWGDGTLIRSENRGTGVRVTAREVSDPRLEGEWEFWLDTDAYGYPGVERPAPRIASYTWRGRNDGGAWVGSGDIFITGVNDHSTVTALLRGEEGYEGLSALLELRYDDTVHDWTVHGFIFAGDVPPIPEPPDA